jgi:rod shape-determining protein MreD
MGVFLSNIFRFIAILGLQIFLFNDPFIQGSTTVGAHALLKPQFYILFILMLPINLNRNVGVAIAFVTGVVMDIFSNTPGLHSSACLILSLIRPVLLERFFQNKLKDATKLVSPSLTVMGFRNFFLYSLIFTTIYNCYYYIIKVWSFQPNKLIYTLMNILVGILISEVLFLISQAFFVNADGTKKMRKRR